jgi:hypothetical protein
MMNRKILKWNQNFELVGGTIVMKLVNDSIGSFDEDEKEKISIRISIVFGKESPGIELNFIQSQKRKYTIISTLAIEYEGENVC